MKIPRLALVSVCLYLLGPLRPLTGRAAVDWPVLGFTQVVSNRFTHPTCITQAADGSGRLFVVQQPGVISIVQSGTVLAQPFLSLTDRVESAGSEQGLLGLAFPEGFPFNGHVYVDYTTATNSVLISRFRVSSTNANVVDPNSEQVLLTIPKPYPNHNGGQLAFGPGGYLYIGVGDGGAEGDPLNFAQNTNSLLGKILRIDVEGGTSPYAIPPDNPFANTPGAAPEIWAYGLRNPWRFSFDRQTYDLYIADVGQDAYEEIDFQPEGSAGGQNYGWSILEGPTNYSVPPGFTNFAAFTPPVAWYSHASVAPVSGGGAAVVGGYVYRGPSQTRMQGIYFYGDFLAGWIWGLTRDGTNWQSQPLYHPSSPSFLITSFGEDEAGELYLADYAQGKLYQVYDTHQVSAPTFSPPGGVINSNTVTLACVTPNADIHLTTNGVDPSLSDPVVASGTVIQVVSGVTYKARAFRSDLTNSAVTSASFTLKAGTPTFNPPGGLITHTTPVTLSTVTPNATIYYTTNGTTPTTSSLVYSGPVPVSVGTTLQALAVAAGYANSDIANAAYFDLRFDSSSGPVSGHMQLRWQSVAGLTYTLQYSSDLVSWSALGSSVQGNGSLLSVIDPDAISSTGQRFYRIATP